MQKAERKPDLFVYYALPTVIGLMLILTAAILPWITGSAAVHWGYTFTGVGLVALGISLTRHRQYHPDQYD